MKKLSVNQAAAINGGTTYTCPFCHNVSGGYWTVYNHALFSGCFKKNPILRVIAGAADFCLSTGIGGILEKQLNLALMKGKHSY